MKITTNRRSSSSNLNANHNLGDNKSSLNAMMTTTTNTFLIKPSGFIYRFYAGIK